MNEELRKEFEEWFSGEMKFTKESINATQEQFDSFKSIALQIWQASREAMKPIRLPVKMKNTEAAECYYYNDAIDDCKEAIEQTGYKAE